MSQIKSPPEQAIKLYSHPLSGHSHRVQLFLSLLKIPHELVLVDLMKGEQKTPEFLAMNAFGQIPVIDDNGLQLADSNAILVYLANRYDAGNWLPKDALGAATTQRWLSVAAGPLFYGPGIARVGNVFKREINKEEALSRSHELFAVMETELAKAPYLTGKQPTIADVAMYTYTAHAPEGDVSLEAYPNIQAWLASVESLPSYLPMTRSPVGLVA